MAKKSPTLPKEYVQPPADMGAAAVTLWCDVVRAMPFRMFTAAQVPMLRTYCEASTVAATIREQANRCIALKVPDFETLERLLDMAAKQERIAQAAARGLRITLQAQRPPPANPAGKARTTNPADEQVEMGWESALGSGDGLPQ